MPRPTRISAISSEQLVYELSIAIAREINYPRNKSYPVERQNLERELIKRLGANWDEYCRINGWDAQSN